MLLSVGAAVAMGVPFLRGSARGVRYRMRPPARAPEALTDDGDPPASSSNGILCGSLSESGDSQCAATGSLIGDTMLLSPNGGNIAASVRASACHSRSGSTRRNMRAASAAAS